MRTVSPRTVAALFSIVWLMAAAPASGQGVHIVPHPDHPDHNAIFLETARLDIRVEAGAARTTVTQDFVNPNPWRAEGIYLFPLPEGAAVTDFRLTMDGRPVSGRVLDREEARRTYLDIVRRIKDPALMEWVGHRVFQARIFPFEARGKRTLTLTYAQVLPREGDFRSYRWESGAGEASTDGGPRITRPQRMEAPPGRPHNTPAPAPRLVVTGEIVAGSAGVGAIHSSTHALDVDRADPERIRFSAEGMLSGRRGFDMHYAEAPGEDVGMDLLMHRTEGEDGYFLMTITPGRLSGSRRVARDIVFVLDTSGSMGSDRKLQQAIQALDFGLGSLERDDRFAVVTYSSSVTPWRPGLDAGTPGLVERARDHVRGLNAAGGTNIEGALAEAARIVQEGTTGDSRRPVYVVFLTDGLPTVGEQDTGTLLAQAGRLFGDRVRLFSWGVGYDVNAFLLDRLASDHGGRAAYVEPMEDLEAKVSAFVSSISSPVLTDLDLRIEGVRGYDLYPRELPDLFAGSHITILGRYAGDGRAVLRLSGRSAGTPRTVTRRLSMPSTASGSAYLGPLWGQRKVGYLLEQIRLNGESEELKDEVVALGEKYGIVTPYTAYLVTEEMKAMAMRAPSGWAVADQASAQRAMARAAAEAAARPSTSLYAAGAGSVNQTGAGAIQSAKAERIMQEATQLQDDSFVTVQRVGTKTFRLDADTQVWQDSEREASQKVVDLEVGDAAYLKLLEKHPELAKYTAVGARVEVVLEGQAYRIQLPK